MRVFGKDITLRTIPWGFLLILLVAALVGAAGTIAAVEFNKHTSTDAFCTSCHSHGSPTDAHASPPTDPHYLQSAHVSNSAGVRPSCGQCHIPMNNFFVETYTHISVRHTRCHRGNDNQLRRPRGVECPPERACEGRARTHAPPGQCDVQKLPLAREHQAGEPGRTGDPRIAAERHGVRRVSSQSRPFPARVANRGR